MSTLSALPTLSVVVHAAGGGFREHLHELADTPVPEGTEFIVASAEAGLDLGIPGGGRRAAAWIALTLPGASERALRRAAMRAARGDIVLFTTPADAGEKLRRLARARCVLGAAPEDECPSGVDP